MTERPQNNPHSLAINLYQELAAGVLQLGQAKNTQDEAKIGQAREEVRAILSKIQELPANATAALNTLFYVLERQPDGINIIKKLVLFGFSRDEAQTFEDTNLRLAQHGLAIHTSPLLPK